MRIKNNPIDMILKVFEENYPEAAKKVKQMLERGDIVKTKDGRIGYVCGIRHTTGKDGYYIRFDDEMIDEEDLVVVRKVDAHYRAYLAHCYLEKVDLILKDFEGGDQDDVDSEAQ